MIEKYRKKPVVIEAIRWDGINWNEMCDFIGVPENAVGRLSDSEMLIDIKTPEETMTAQIGDFIIKGIQGEFYPCKPDIFYATYEKVEDDA
uniref:Phage protein n=1 Tax=viral metagenome TaxID=1070528 RepID=A0A6H1ZG01_9ZZZZ